MNKIQKLLVEKYQGLKLDNIAIYDVKNKTPLNDFIIVVTSRTSATIAGTMEETIRVLRENKIDIHHTEYKNRSLWCLIDCGYFLVHIFAPGERERMKFDELYSSCPHKYFSYDGKEKTELELEKPATDVSYWK